MSVLKQNIAKTFREEELVTFENANDALLYAALHNKVDSLILLLSDEDVDPTAKIGVFESDATMSAMIAGNTESVKLLLKDHRVFNAINKQYLLIEAIRKHDMEIIKLLLSFDYKFNYVRALEETILFDYLDGFKLISNDYPIDYTKIELYCFDNIIENRKYEMLELLLNNKQNLSQEQLHHMFHHCLIANRTEMVNMLYEAGSIDYEYIAKYANDLIEIPIRYENAEIIQKFFNPKDTTLRLYPNFSFLAKSILDTAQNTEK